MKRLLRILVGLLAGLSLQLLAATVVAWARGYWSHDYVSVTREVRDHNGSRQNIWSVSSGHGEMAFCFQSRRCDAPAAGSGNAAPSVRWETFTLHDRPNSPAEFLRIQAGLMFWVTDEWVFDRWSLVLLYVEEREPTLLLSEGKFVDARGTVYAIAVPCWMLALLFALLPGQRVWAIVRRRARRRHRQRQGLCLQCGYDLRATPDPAGPRLSRCPECGLAVSRP